MRLHSRAEDDPALDVALSHAMLERAARQKVPCVRLWRPRRAALSLGRLDVRAPGMDEVVAAARQAGIAPVRRLSGGRAAVVDEGCLNVGWAQPDPLLAGSRERYELMTGAIVRALETLGVSATRAELDGEWCPGTWSVHGSGGKLVGVAQRVINGGAWCEAMIVIDPSPSRSEIARRVHRALGIPWSAGAQGALAEELPGADHAIVIEALERALQQDWPQLERSEPEPDLVARAAELRAEHTTTQEAECP